MNTEEECIKLKHISCPQCKTRIPLPAKKCWFCNMLFEEMCVKFICNDCGMHFTDYFDLDGNSCRRTLCRSRNIKMIFRKDWTMDEKEFIKKNIYSDYRLIARKLKRPPVAVHRKLFRLKKEMNNK